MADRRRRSRVHDRGRRPPGDRPGTPEVHLTTEPPDPRRVAGVAAFAVAYGILHHSGTLFTPLGRVGGSGALGQTRWADWLDLATPWLVLLPVAWALIAGGASRATWALFGAGALAYVEGHGVHLAANSVGNVQPSDLVHLWDEVVGHYALHAGVALIVTALITAFGRDPVPRLDAGVPLALGVGVTHATNAIEGGTAVFGIAVAALFVAWGWRLRRSAGVLLLWAYVVALAILIGYGAWRGGFPQPSEAIAVAGEEVG